MASSLVARLALVAAGSLLFIIGLADAVSGRAWALLEIAGAAVLLMVVAVEASGIIRIPRRRER